MIRRYNYRRTLPHLQKDNRPVFVSFNTLRRWVLPEAARDLVLECCIYQNGKMAVVHAVVVMPEHVHMIFTPRLDGTAGPYSVMEIMQNIKSVSARRVNAALKRKGSVWLRELFDHILRSADKLNEKIEYLRQNPVRRGLCDAPEHYRWLWVNPEDFH